MNWHFRFGFKDSKHDAKEFYAFTSKLQWTSKTILFEMPQQRNNDISRPVRIPNKQGKTQNWVDSAVPDQTAGWAEEISLPSEIKCRGSFSLWKVLCAVWKGTWRKKRQFFKFNVFLICLSTSLFRFVKCEQAFQVSNVLKAWNSSICAHISWRMWISMPTVLSFYH